MKHKNTQPLYIFNRENPQNSEPQNGPRSGLDYIALTFCTGPLNKHKHKHHGCPKVKKFGSASKAKLFLEATKTRPHFSLPKVIIQVQTGLEYSTG